MKQKNKKLQPLLLVLFLMIFNLSFLQWPSFLFSEGQKIPPLLHSVQAQEAVEVPGTPMEKFTPNTSNLQPQWNHNMINIGQAWADGYTGAGISIAVLDTGFFIQHPDSSIAGGYSVFADDPWSNDHSGHGTHIAGIISAKRGTPYQGIAPDAEVYGIKIYHEKEVDENGEVSTNVTNVVNGLQYAMDLGVDIIVISSGLSYHDAELYQAIKQAHDQNIMLIAASGNGHAQVNYPAHYSEVIAVTALDDQFNPALDIIYGQENEFSAPGVHIGGLSIPESSYSYPYIFMSGSSQAAPHAAGLAAILMQKHGQRGEAIRQIMQNQALDIGDAGLFGYGLLQYVSADDAKNNELIPADEAASADTIPAVPRADTARTESLPETPENLRKPSSSREADVAEPEAGDDLMAFYQTDIVVREDSGVLEENILALVEDRGTLQINMGDRQSLFLTENQVSQIRTRNLSLILAKDKVSWTLPPANLVPGAATLRFYEGAPTGVERYKGTITGLQTISIYQEGSRHDAYPSTMKISYDMDAFSMDDILSFRACYFDKKAGAWKTAESQIANDQIILQTKYTTAVGFLDRHLTREVEEGAIVADEKKTGADHTTSAFLATLTGQLTIGLFVVLGIFFSWRRWLQKKQEHQK